MTLRFSVALTNSIAEHGSWKSAFDNGAIDIYTGTQPATPDAAPTGTLLCTITSGGGAQVNEVQSQGSVLLTGGSSGSVNTLTVNGVEIMGSATAFDTSLTQTAADIALKINRNPKNRLYVASSAGALITLTARRGQGVLPNGWVVANSLTTITTTNTAMGSVTAGVDAVNGLRMDFNAVAGMITKDVTQSWWGTAIGAGTQTAGWFRFRAAVADPNTLDTTASYSRMDGAIATSGADLNMSSTSIANGAVQTLSTFSFTVPAA